MIKINLFERLKKYRKELEKICKIPTIKIENKTLINHLKSANDKIDELQELVLFYKNNYDKVNDENFILKRERKDK